MINLIIFLRNFARYVEDKAEDLRKHAEEKLREERLKNARAMQESIDKQAQEWDREAKRHRDALERIRVNKEAAIEKHECIEVDINDKIKQIELV